MTCYSKDEKKSVIRMRSPQDIGPSGTSKPGWWSVLIRVKPVNGEIAEKTIIISTIRTRRANATSILTKTVIRCQGEAMPRTFCQEGGHDELGRAT